MSQLSTSTGCTLSAIGPLPGLTLTILHLRPIARCHLQLKHVWKPFKVVRHIQLPKPLRCTITSLIRVAQASRPLRSWKKARIDEIQVRRLMEDDNNKQRKAARREFQDNVRALVAFVRKRDVRVIAWMEQEEVKKAELKAAEARRLGPLRRTLHDTLSRPLPTRDPFLLMLPGSSEHLEMSLCTFGAACRQDGTICGTVCHDRTIRRRRGTVMCTTCTRCSTLIMPCMSTLYVLLAPFPANVLQEGGRKRRAHEEGNGV